MVNGVLRSLQREGVSDLSEITNKLEKVALVTSFPLWLVQRWSQQYGYETTKRMCEESLKPPSVTMRVNRLKATVEEAIELLSAEGIKAEAGSLAEDALTIDSGQVFESQAYKSGLVTAQDQSSMLVARALGPAPEQQVLDACAAPGGKSTHLAELMENRGALLSSICMPIK